MHRLLIADSDDSFLLAASQVFSADYEVQTCQDGETALELLATFQPQVLILNLFLPFKDGLTVLQEAAVLPPVTIAITTMILPHIEAACSDLNVGFLMVSPCLNALRVRVTHMVNLWESDGNTPDLHAQARMHLNTLNFPSHRTGYRQLLKALPMYYKDRDQCLDTVLYAQIAEMFYKSGNKAVERAIRAVIVDAWEQRDQTVWRKFFPNQTECPSNKVFFDALADQMQE